MHTYKYLSTYVNVELYTKWALTLGNSLPYNIKHINHSIVFILFILSIFTIQCP